MEIVISDTNIFIDLWNIGLLERFCELPCKHPTPMTIQLHPQCLLGIQGILRNWTFLIFKQV